MKVFLIYCLTNKINGKKYIGKFNRDIKKFSSYFGGGTLIKRAIKKHGKHSFHKEILEECNCISDLNKQEIYWIFKLGTSENGYNLLKGGDGGDTSKFINYKDEKYVEKKRSSSKKYWENLTKEERDARSKRLSGENNPMYGKEGFWRGKKIPKQPFNKNRQKFGDKNPNWNGGSSKHYCHCGNQIGYGVKCCIDCCDRSGKRNPFYNKKHSNRTKKIISKKNKGRLPPNTKPVEIDGIKYASASHASKKLNISPLTIRWRIISKNSKFKNYKYQ